MVPLHRPGRRAPDQDRERHRRAGRAPAADVGEGQRAPARRPVGQERARRGLQRGLLRGRAEAARRGARPRRGLAAQPRPAGAASCATCSGSTSSTETHVRLRPRPARVWGSSTSRSRSGSSTTASTSCSRSNDSSRVTRELLILETAIYPARALARLVHVPGRRAAAYAPPARLRREPGRGEGGHLQLVPARASRRCARCSQTSASTRSRSSPPRRTTAPSSPAASASPTPTAARSATSPPSLAVEEGPRALPRRRGLDLPRPRREHGARALAARRRARGRQRGRRPPRRARLRGEERRSVSLVSRGRVPARATWRPASRSTIEIAHARARRSPAATARVRHGLRAPRVVRRPRLAEVVRHELDGRVEARDKNSAESSETRSNFPVAVARPRHQHRRR